MTRTWTDSVLRSFLILGLAAVLFGGCARKKTGEPEIFTFSAAGELRPALDGRPLFGTGKDGNALSAITDPLLSRDLVMADVAGGFDPGCRPPARSRTFRWNPEWLSLLSSANIRVINLADDHALDCGREALSRAINSMLGQGFYITGAGRNQGEANAPVYFTRDNVTIAAASFLLDQNPGIDPCKDCAGPSMYDRTAMINSLKEMKKRAAYHLVVLHFRERDLPRLDPDEQAVIREAVDFGADLVIGYGTASAGGLARIRGRWVIGGMGRLTGETTPNPGKLADGLLLSAEFTTDRMMNLRLAAVAIEDGAPRLLRGDEGEAALQKLRSAADLEVQDNSVIVGDILYLK